MIEGLRRLRVRLTAWYVAVFGAVLLAFAASLLWVVAHKARRTLDRSLEKAAAAVVTAAEIAAREGPAGPVRVDALDELRIPDRSLYLFDQEGRLLHPDTASAFVRLLADRVAASGEPQMRTLDLPNGLLLRAYALPVTLANGDRRITVAVGEALDIDTQYPGLLLAFGGAAAGALLLAAVGGWLLALRSIRPVDQAFGRMRNFMADAAHELRTPVAVLKGHAEVALRHPRSPEDYVETLKAIHAETDRLGGILANLLTLATADAGAWPERREALFLDDVLLDAASSARALAGQKDIALEVSSLDEMPVRGDPQLLHQLFMILLDNAITATPEGGVIFLAARRIGATGEVVVEDTGPGISDEALARAFERFYRGDPARSRSAGAGLGLPIAHWIAESHGGTVHLERLPRIGTRATVTLPIEAE